MRWDRPPVHEVQVTLPAWVIERVEYDRRYEGDEERMRLAVDLSRENVERGTGGPFGAAVFEAATGRLIAVGVNGVTRLNNGTAHAEIVALQLAGRRVASYSLCAEGQPAHELFTSCAPCAMCLGAALWSGVSRIVCGALREDAEAVGFDEGPVFPASWAYLEARGVRATLGVLRDEARAVLERYVALGGPVYNATRARPAE
jgi:tRNA(Arg) A34 adenosine deaminase TadA